MQTPLQDIRAWKGLFSPGFRRVFVYLRPERAKLWLLASLGLLYVPLSLIEPYILMFLVDRVVMAGRPELLVPFTLRVLPFFVLATAIEFLMMYVLLKLARDLHAEIKAVQLDNLLAKGTSFFRNTRAGATLFSFFNDSSSIGATLSVGLVNALMNIVFIFARLGILCFVDASLTLTYAVVIPFQALVMFRMIKVVMRLEIDLKKRDEELTARIESLISGAVVIKAFGFGGALAEIWKRRFGARLDVDLRNMVWKQLGAMGIYSLQAFAVFALLFVGVHQIAAGEITLGTLLAFLAIAGRLTPSLTSVIGFMVGIQEGLVNIERYFRIYDLPDEKIEFARSNVTAGRPGRRELSASDLERIRVRDVLLDHGYGAVVRCPCNFEMSRGRRYGWHGPNGAGKTSLALGLAGLVPHSRGSILCGGTPLHEFRLESVRREILYAGNEPFWPERSLAENFKGDRGAGLDTERLKRALWASCSQDVLDALPGGMETVLSHDAHILSRGENQRLFLALTLYREPQVLILDEALSAVSEANVARVLERLRGLEQPSILVMVSQRASEIALCDEPISFSGVA